MKIAIIGPGKMEIPPKTWGAVEILIWDYYNGLKALGHDVMLVNTPDMELIAQQVNEINPDFVHLHYDEYYAVLDKIQCKNKVVTSHYGYLEAYHEYRPYVTSKIMNFIFSNRILRKALFFNRKLQSIYSYKKYFDQFINGSHTIYCLSDRIDKTYREFGFTGNSFIVPNGAREDLFNFTLKPKYPEHSIYLAKIDFRKRQYIYQNIPNVYFVGGIVDNRFNAKSANYLGLWSKEQIYMHLTDYANLVLLSDGEAHALVCCEALMAGLGLVVSEYASANLDISLPFIDVIPIDKLNDIAYVSEVISKNREQSIKHREQIRQYAVDNFSWNKLVMRYSDHIKQECAKS